MREATSMAQVFALCEAQGATPEWVDGIERWWKKWFKFALARVKELARQPMAQDATKEDLQRFADYAIMLRGGVTNLRRLRDDILYNKGFFPYSIKGDVRGEKHETNVVLYALSDAINRLEGASMWYADSVVAGEYPTIADRPKHLRDYIAPRDLGISADAWKDTLDASARSLGTVDRHVAKAFKALRALIDKGHSYQYKPIEREFSIGRMQVVISPMIDIMMTKGVDAPGVFKRRLHSTVTWHDMRIVVNVIKNAYERLRSLRLDHLWYGSIQIQGKGAGARTDASGRKFSAIAAYGRLSDSVMLYIEDAVDAIRDTIYHELGHRQWHKFLSDGQRAQWRGREGQTPTSEYGKTNVDEEYAEAFEQFCAGTIDRDTKQRFISVTFAGGAPRSRKLEAVRTMRALLVDAGRLAAEDFTIVAPQGRGRRSGAPGV